MATLSALFDSSQENSFERRLTMSWNSLTKINAYEEVCLCGFLRLSLCLRLCQKNNRAPNFRATRIYADTLLCVHNDIADSDSVGAHDLTRPCIRLNEYVVRITSSTTVLSSSLGITGHSRTHMFFCPIQARCHRSLHRSQRWTLTSSGTLWFQSCS